MILPIILAAALTVLHFFSERISEKIDKYHEDILSFSAGLFISVLFLFLLPEVIRGGRILQENIYIYLLIGLIGFHLAEKYLYQHIKHKKELLKDLAELHSVGFFIDHFVVGFLLVIATEAGRTGFILAIPFILHTISSSISLKHIHNHFKHVMKHALHTPIKIILSLSTVIGAVVATYLVPITSQSFYQIYAIGIGALLYISMRDMLPKGKKGNLVLFAIGVLISLIAFILVV